MRFFRETALKSNKLKMPKRKYDQTTLQARLKVIKIMSLEQENLTFINRLKISINGLGINSGTNVKIKNFKN
jgi:hypothetical protein